MFTYDGINMVNYPPIQSDFYFLGERSYVQGSTLLEGVVSAARIWKLPKLIAVETSCREMVSSQAVYVYTGSSLGSQYEEVMSDESIKASFKLKDELGACHAVSLIGASGGVFGVQSVPFDEDKLINGYSFDLKKNTIRLDNVNFDFINISKLLIALQKKLLDAIFPKDGFGRWVYYSSTLEWPHMSDLHQGVLKVCVTRSLGLKVVECSAYFEDSYIGKQCFTREVMRCVPS